MTGVTDTQTLINETKEILAGLSEHDPQYAAMQRHLEYLERRLAAAVAKEQGWREQRDETVAKLAEIAGGM